MASDPECAAAGTWNGFVTFDLDKDVRPAPLVDSIDENFSMLYDSGVRRVADTEISHLSQPTIFALNSSC